MSLERKAAVQLNLTVWHPANAATAMASEVSSPSPSGDWDVVSSRGATPQASSIPTPAGSITTSATQEGQCNQGDLGVEICRDQNTSSPSLGRDETPANRSDQMISFRSNTEPRTPCNSRLEPEVNAEGQPLGSGVGTVHVGAIDTRSDGMSIPSFEWLSVHDDHDGTQASPQVSPERVTAIPSQAISRIAPWTSSALTHRSHQHVDIGSQLSEQTQSEGGNTRWSDVQGIGTDDCEWSMDSAPPPTPPALRSRGPGSRNSENLEWGQIRIGTNDDSTYKKGNHVCESERSNYPHHWQDQRQVEQRSDEMGQELKTKLIKGAHVTTCPAENGSDLEVVQRIVSATKDVEETKSGEIGVKNSLGGIPSTVFDEWLEVGSRITSTNGTEFIGVSSSPSLDHVSQDDNIDNNRRGQNKKAKVEKCKMVRHRLAKHRYKTVSASILSTVVSHSSATNIESVRSPPPSSSPSPTRPNSVDNTITHERVHMDDGGETARQSPWSSDWALVRGTTSLSSPSQSLAVIEESHNISPHVTVTSTSPTSPPLDTAIPPLSVTTLSHETSPIPSVPLLDTSTSVSAPAPTPAPVLVARLPLSSASPPSPSSPINHRTNSAGDHTSVVLSHTTANMGDPSLSSPSPTTPPPPPPPPSMALPSLVHPSTDFPVITCQHCQVLAKPKQRFVPSTISSPISSNDLGDERHQSPFSTLHLAYESSYFLCVDCYQRVTCHVCEKPAARVTPMRSPRCISSLRESDANEGKASPKVESGHDLNKVEDSNHPRQEEDKLSLLQGPKEDTDDYGDITSPPSHEGLKDVEGGTGQDNGDKLEMEDGIVRLVELKEDEVEWTHVEVEGAEDEQQCMEEGMTQDKRVETVPPKVLSPIKNSYSTGIREDHNSSGRNRTDVGACNSNDSDDSYNSNTKEGEVLSIGIEFTIVEGVIVCDACAVQIDRIRQPHTLARHIHTPLPYHTSPSPISFFDTSYPKNHTTSRPVLHTIPTSFTRAASFHDNHLVPLTPPKDHSIPFNQYHSTRIHVKRDEVELAQFTPVAASTIPSSIWSSSSSTASSPSCSASTALSPPASSSRSEGRSPKFSSSLESDFHQLPDCLLMGLRAMLPARLAPVALDLVPFVPSTRGHSYDDIEIGGCRGDNITSMPPVTPIRQSAIKPVKATNATVGPSLASARSQRRSHSVDYTEIQPTW